MLPLCSDDGGAFGERRRERRQRERRVDAEGVSPEFLAVLVLCGGEGRSGDGAGSDAGLATSRDRRRDAAARGP